MPGLAGCLPRRSSCRLRRSWRARDDLRLPDGRSRLVRHAHAPERQVQTGIGSVPVSRVKIRDRGVAVEGDRVRLSPAILPRWARRTKSLDALLPVLYLQGVSTRNFQDALAALLGKGTANLSPAVIGRLTASTAWPLVFTSYLRTFHPLVPVARVGESRCRVSFVLNFEPLRIEQLC